MANPLQGMSRSRLKHRVALETKRTHDATVKLNWFVLDFIYVYLFLCSLNSTSYARVEERSLPGNDSSECGTAVEEPRRREMNFNQTTPHISTPSPRPWVPGHYTFIPFVLLALLLCVSGMVSSPEFILAVLIVALHDVMYMISVPHALRLCT